MDLHDTSLSVHLTFLSLFFAFILILPGIRKNKSTSFSIVLFSLSVGLAIFEGLQGSSWQTSTTNISSVHKAFSKERLKATLTIRIGLNNVDVSLKSNENCDGIQFHYNEKLDLTDATSLENHFHSGLETGLPFPILTVLEYLAVDGDSFTWGSHYRIAGHYTEVTLGLSLSVWFLSNLLLLLIPRYAADLVVFLGFSLLLSTGIYFLSLPRNPLIIHIEQDNVKFFFGRSFWMVFTGGCISILIGGTVSILDRVTSNQFYTSFELDFGTPFDRRSVMRDSLRERNKWKTRNELEEPISVKKAFLSRRQQDTHDFDTVPSVRTHHI